jgi:hypothetical protein
MITPIATLIPSMVVQKVWMLRCAASFVIAAYFYVRLIPHDWHALPANFLRNHHIFELFTGSSPFLSLPFSLNNPTQLGSMMI